MSNELKRVAELLEEAAGDLPMDSSQSLSLWRTAHAIREALAERGGERTKSDDGVNRATGCEASTLPILCRTPTEAGARGSQGTPYPDKAASSDLAPSDNLVERLRALKNNWANERWSIAPPICEEAALAIKARDAEIARLSSPVGDEEVRETAAWLRVLHSEVPPSKAFAEKAAALLERLARRAEERVLRQIIADMGLRLGDD